MTHTPFAHPTDEQIERIGREFDAIHEEVYADLGDRDRRYITGVIRMHRQLAVAGRALLVGSRDKPLWRWAPGRWRWPRSRRTWSSGTTSCTGSGTG